MLRKKTDNEGQQAPQTTRPVPAKARELINKQSNWRPVWIGLHGEVRTGSNAELVELMKNLNESDHLTIGDRELSAWQVAPGVVWVQTRNPEHARKLSRRINSRLVASGVAGGYLRTFEFCQNMAWGSKLIARYTLADAGLFQLGDPAKLPVRCRCGHNPAESIKARWAEASRLEGSLVCVAKQPTVRSWRNRLDLTGQPAHRQHT